MSSRLPNGAKSPDEPPLSLSRRGDARVGIDAGDEAFTVAVAFTGVVIGRVFAAVAAPGDAESIADAIPIAPV